MNPLTDSELLTFKSITSFVEALQHVIRNQRPLALYHKLLVRTTLGHLVPIRKHTTVFRDFCTANTDAILTQRHSALTASRIAYSDSVFIDMPSVFAATTEHAVVWRHLLTILALVDPTSDARSVLADAADMGGPVPGVPVPESRRAPNEMAFLTGLMEKVERAVPAEASGMEAVAKLLSSGLVADIVTGMNTGLRDGSLDVGRLLQTVQTVMQTMPKDGPGASVLDNPLMAEVLQNLGGGGPAFSQFLGQLSGGGGLPPEMAVLAQTLTSALDTGDVRMGEVPAGTTGTAGTAGTPGSCGTTGSSGCL